MDKASIMHDDTIRVLIMYAIEQEHRAKDILFRLRRLCNHVSVDSKNDQAVCFTCRTELGRSCYESEKGFCDYSSEICVYCGRKEEKK